MFGKDLLCLQGNTDWDVSQTPLVALASIKIK